MVVWMAVAAATVVVVVVFCGKVDDDGLAVRMGRTLEERGDRPARWRKRSREVGIENEAEMGIKSSGVCGGGGREVVR